MRFGLLLLLLCGGASGEGVVSMDKLAKFQKKVKQERLHKESVEIFEKFDEDNNKYLNRLEMAKIFKHTNPEDSPWHDVNYFTIEKYYEFCKDLGANPIYGLTLAQLEQAYKEDYGNADADYDSTKQLKVLKLPASERKLVKDVFVRFDEDSDGYLEFSEVAAMTNATEAFYMTLIASEGADPSQGLSLMNLLRLYAGKDHLHSAVRRHHANFRDAALAEERQHVEELLARTRSVLPPWAMMGVLVVPLAAAMVGANTKQGAKWIRRNVKLIGLDRAARD